MEENTLRYICRECSFPGRAYIPRDQDVRGGILVLHGSEGGGFGTHDRTAVLLACHGFTALAYDWCGSYERPVDGLPSKVVDIAIEGPVKIVGHTEANQLRLACRINCDWPAYEAVGIGE